MPLETDIQTNSKTIQIRTATKMDVPRLQKMICALADHHGDTATVTIGDLDRDLFGEKPWFTALVAEMDHTLIGYAVLCPMAQLQFGNRGMDMHHLFVSKCARGQGVGRQLIDASLREASAQGCRYMTVGTHPANKSAQATYLAVGFEAAPSLGPRFRKGIIPGACRY